MAIEIYFKRYKKRYQNDHRQLKIMRKYKQTQIIGYKNSLNTLSKKESLLYYGRWEISRKSDLINLNIIRLEEQIKAIDKVLNIKIEWRPTNLLPEDEVFR